MTLRTEVFDRCTGFAGIAALIAARCFPDRVPENPTYPLIVFHAPVSADNSQYRTHDPGPTEREVSRVQFDCFDATGDGAAALADQIRLAWDGHKDGCVIGWAFQANRIQTREDALNKYRTIVDVLIEHSVP